MWTVQLWKVRIIPAYAGKTEVIAEIRPAIADHPCLRGENVARSSPEAAARGSSLLTRGKCGFAVKVANEDRIIPAYAGKTGSKGNSTIPLEDHPCLRGENACQNSQTI